MAPWTALNAVVPQEMLLAFLVATGGRNLAQARNKGGKVTFPVVELVETTGKDSD